MKQKYLSVLHGKTLDSFAAVVELFPHSVAQAEQIVEDIIREMSVLRDEVISCPPVSRTYYNTVKKYDDIAGLAHVMTSITGLFRQVSGDIVLRNAPYNRAQSAATDLIKDVRFYKAFCEYREFGLSQEIVTSEQQAFFEKVFSGFLRLGYDKDLATFDQLIKVEQEMQRASAQFDKAFNDALVTLAFYEDELTGVAPDVIASQSRDEQGRVLLICNRPTMFAVLPYCTNPLVRKAFKQAYDRRAYPENSQHLTALLAARRTYAQLLGYKNYAEYALADHMVGASKEVDAFLACLSENITSLCARDSEKLLTTLPDDVVLIEGKLASWDVAYVLAAYEKAVLHIDGRLVSEYFPIETTIAGVFAIYQKFFGLDFEYTRQVPGAWDELVQGIAVYTKDRTRILGYILLDLFPRQQKFSHACCWEIIPRTWGHSLDSGMLEQTPSVSVIVANFPEATGDAPALLSHTEVTTFFHEFGHALHNIMSCTAHTQTSGSMMVMLDYVELPSQILEEWMWNADMLQLVSRHYKTQEPLPSDIIQKITQARLFGRSFFEMNQLYLSRLSLELHRIPGDIDLDAVLREAFIFGMPAVALDEENKFYASFGHLPAYGPAYYGYSLSRAYAYDVFKKISEYGLLNEAIGAEFAQKVLAPGSSIHPITLLTSFLGRPPSLTAYMDFLKND